MRKPTPALNKIVAVFITTTITTLSIGVASSTPKANVINLTAPSNQQFTTNPLSVSAQAIAGTPTISVSGPATYTAGKILLTGVGTVVVSAKETTAPTGYVLPAPVSNSFSVTQANQTISAFAPIRATNWSKVAPIITITKPAATSKLPVTLSVISGPGTLTGSNSVTATSAGEITIAADQPGNNNYLPASRVTTTILVNKGSNNLTAFVATTPTAPNYGTNQGKFTISIPKGKSSAPVVITASGASVATDQTIATITPTGAGTVVLHANQEGDANWTAATQIQKSVVVEKAHPGIKPKANITTKFVKNAPAVNITPSSASSGVISYTVTSGPGTVDTSGNVTITGAGTIVVTATQAASSDGNYAATARPVVVNTITVTKGTQTITATNIPTPAKGSVVYGGTFSIPKITSDVGTPCVYTVTGGAYNAATEKITITAVGTIVIKATAPATANYNATGPVTISTLKVSKNGGLFVFSEI